MSRSYDRKDHLYLQAKAEGYRSRAAYKLKEINQKERLIRPGMRILDLGAWPGGWVQVAAQCTGRSGLVVGIDLQGIEDLGLSQVKLITGDVREEQNLTTALQFAGGRFDVILSDMSAKLSGIREVDQTAAVGCAELALWAAGKALKQDGALVIKVFKCAEIDAFVKSMRALFNKTARVQLKASQKHLMSFI